jgi:hypothetical protein
MLLGKPGLLGGAVFIMSLFSAKGNDMQVAAVAAMKIETVTIRNPVCEAVITSKPFVHLISFRLLGEKNHLLNFETPNPVANGHLLRPLFIVGAKLWYAPEVIGSAGFGLLAAAKINEKANEVDVVLTPDPNSGLQGNIRFVLDEHEPRLTITSVLRNGGAKARETSCWWPVSFEPGGRMEAEVIPSPAEPAFSYHFWSYGGTASESACRISKTKVVLNLDQPLQHPIFKIGFIGKEIVLTKPDCVYRMTALAPDVDPRVTYPHGGSPVMLYCDQRSGFCEAELSGPLVKLQPQDETSFTFSISLEKPKVDR